MRKKMLYLVVLLFLLPFINVGATINLTYIVKKYKDKIQPSCIAEEFERYAAVGWVYPIPTSERGIPNITTKFIPSISNDYNCKFSKNNVCNTRWSLRDWKIDESSARTRDFIPDRRWEDLPTIFISKDTTEFKERFEVDTVFRSGLSVRAGSGIELLVCSGWNPYSYPCYYFSIESREIYLTKYATLPKNITDDFKTTALQHYKAFSNILSSDEWRNFVVSHDKHGVIKLIDVNLNRTVIEYEEKQPLTPMYILMRSRNASLWKIHENHFLSTTTAQISRLGPQLTIFNKDLCVSLFVSSCDNCEMNFFYQNATIRKVLKNVGPTKNNDWVEIKLKEENIQVDKVNLFVETKFKDAARNQTVGFWAVDDIRVCNENEVKVSFLKLNNTLEGGDVDEDDVSCQLIKKPSWRPKKLTYNEIKDFSDIQVTSNATSIQLSWKQEDPTNQINYFVSYQANDICASEPYNLKRLKSNGFLMTKHNEIVIDNLVPYTNYNITLSTVLHEKDKQLQFHTLETVEPHQEELPYKIQVRASDTVVYISWEKVNCMFKYGRLVYTLTVSNEGSNFSKELSIQTETSYEIDGLQPFTPYSLKIVTARNGRNIYQGIHSSSIVLNFTTLAGVAPAIQNLEAYSIDKNSASLRYDLPGNPNGIPKEIQVNKCNALSFKKCKSYILPVKKCKLWRNKYCEVVNNLIPFQKYSLRLSLKNVNTHAFGKEATVDGYTTDRVPGPPTNITYKIVDCQASTEYCHLNVTWLHPYNQNGTITSFDIILNSTSKHKDSEDAKFIHEVYKIDNKTYQPQYTYQIKYLPYSTHYDLYLQSSNAAFKSNFVQTVVKTDDIGDHIDQSPKLLGKSDSSLVFEVPRLDRRLKFYTLTVVVQDFNSSREVDSKILVNKKVAENLCHKFGDTWISRVVKVENNGTENIVIGNSEKERIKPKTKYCVTFIITNSYKESEHDVVYYEKLETPESTTPIKEATSSPYSHLYILLLLVLLVPAGFLLYRYLKKRRVIPKPSENGENVYETLPFDECESNCVNNENYDQLLHK